ncbi:hypothetical protein [Rhizobium sp. BT03]|uniref:hypothetical protein n=1 Tax=Rhizobium sp. BT03 TaxID=3045156 RepID=UPI0024B3D116|nr:hypothetical protein [Rhizobium sp. BT03]WHO76260.1 hypothetical protein QMO80_005370 [Rhizobium sp. BT03]
MLLKTDFKSPGAKLDRMTLGVLAGLVIFAVGPSAPLAQDAAIAPIKANAETVGERVQAVAETLVQTFDFGADLSPKTLIKTLPGDWAMLSSDSSHGMSPSSLKKWCAFNGINLKQPDSSYPIFDGRMGREGSSRRFELRLSVGAAMYWISNVQAKTPLRSLKR